MREKLQGCYTVQGLKKSLQRWGNGWEKYSPILFLATKMFHDFDDEACYTVIFFTATWFGTKLGDML